MSEELDRKVIVSDIRWLRDPYIVVDNGNYYAYGTCWYCYKNTSGKLDGHWEGPEVCVEIPEDAIDQHWAPEVHRYNGKFYMFTTYKSAKTGHRGCTILVSDKPEGKFREISNGHVTPKDWDCIDGTLYIDREGKPWIVFVHEWTCTDDHVGRFDCARLSDDLTEMIGEPHEMFRADEPEWAVQGVTDGCWMYTTVDGELLMLWSNFDEAGYCEAISHSEDGTVMGKWKHEKKPLYSKSFGYTYDGGHGMIFTALDGKKYLSLHSPNGGPGRPETPVFIEVKEENGTIVIC